MPCLVGRTIRIGPGAHQQPSRKQREDKSGDFTGCQRLAAQNEDEEAVTIKFMRKIHAWY